MRFIGRAVILAGAVLLLLFAISNRGTVSLGLWPLPFLVGVPLYLLFFLTLLIGVLIGLSMAWIAGHHHRRELQRRRRRIEALERELSATQSQLVERRETPLAALPASRPS